jgi:hypothetical protein
VLGGLDGAIGLPDPPLPVLAEQRGTPGFAGLIADESLFQPGANRLDLLLVDRDETRLRRLGTDGG